MPANARKELPPSIVRGGPLHQLLDWCGLTAADGLPTRTFIISLAVFAWLAPIVLALLQTWVDPVYNGVEILSDWTVHTRFLIAIAIMLLTERYADNRFNLLLAQFRQTQLIPESGEKKFATIIADSDRWSEAKLPEYLLLLVAFILPGVTASYVVNLTGSSWEGHMAGTEVVFSWAGLAARYFSTPLFQFLMLRWIWRFLVWTIMLYRISNMRLKLSPLHPDRCAGLGFLSIYPTVFSGFIFALSSVVAASIAKEITLMDINKHLAWILMGCWVVLILIIFIGPMLVFVRKLAMEREQAMLDYGRLCSQHHQAFQRKWVDAKADGAELYKAGDSAVIADLNDSVAILGCMKAFPVDKATVIQILLASGLPLLAAATKLMPLMDIVKKLLSALV